MEADCYDFDLDDCVDYPFDSFGGHTKVGIVFLHNTVRPDSSPESHIL